MKKFILFLMSFGMALPSFSAGNNIKMVTYFPVPYASYQNLDVEKTLDVGVMSCAMDLTCPTNQYALNVYEDANPGSSVLKKGYLRVTSGRMNLNSSGKAVSNVMTVGNHSGSGGELDFGQDLRIAALSNRGQSLEAANDGNVVSALKMFPDHINNNFPACTGAEGAPDVSWQSLELGAQDNKAVTNVFLVCGKPKAGEAEKSCTENKYQDKCKCPSVCPSGQVRTDVVYEVDGACCESDIQFTYTTEILSAVESGCTGPGASGSVTVCLGSYGAVTWEKKYSDLAFTRCESRTGAQCGNENWVYLTSNDTESYPKNTTGPARCSGSSTSLPECSALASSYGVYQSDICSKRGYEGYACISSYYNRGCSHVNTVPCTRDGDYCRLLESTRDGGFVSAAHSVSVMKCVKK